MSFDLSFRWGGEGLPKNENRFGKTLKLQKYTYSRIQLIRSIFISFVTHLRVSQRRCNFSFFGMRLKLQQSFLFLLSQVKKLRLLSISRLSRDDCELLVSSKSELEEITKAITNHFLCEKITKKYIFKTNCPSIITPLTEHTRWPLRGSNFFFSGVVYDTTQDRFLVTK